VERNPVRAGLVKRAWQWPWSSAAGHVSGRGDVLVRPGGPLAAEITDWRRFLSAEDDEATLETLRRHARTGRPLGADAFVSRLERSLGRTLHPQRPGPKPGGAAGR
jgi:putative transposase